MIMNHRIKFFFILLLACLVAYPQEEIATLRLMTYNIRHGAGMDDVLDLDRQAEIIRQAMPDVVGVQEVDSFVRRSNRIDEAGYLGQKLGMYATFGPAIPLTGGKYGVAILSKEQPLSVSNTPLPGEEKRTLLVCEFENYVFATTHLDLNEDNRLASLSIILEEAARWDKPFFICGDWNDTPTSTLIKTMKKNFAFLNYIMDSATAYTFPANKPSSTIDYIASYGKVVKAIRTRKVINEPVASDHRPVIVEVRIDFASDILPIPAEEQYESGIYDLDGRNVGKAHRKGIFVRKGKKVKI